jgi:hypothetical protein
MLSDDMTDGRTVDVLLLDGDNKEGEGGEGQQMSDPFWYGTLILVIMTYIFATLITGIATMMETPGQNIGIVLGYITMLTLTGPLAFRVRGWNNGWWRCDCYLLGIMVASMSYPFRKVETCCCC